MIRKRTGFFVIAMVAILSVALAPTMSSAYAATTGITYFSKHHVCVLNGIDTRYNSGTSNYDGDLDLSANTDHTSGDVGSVHAFALKKVYIPANKQVSLAATATADISNNNGYNHVKAYVSPASEYRYSSLLGCWQSGSDVSGSSATMSYVGPDGSKSGSIYGTSSFKVPSSGYYNVIIYADAQTQVNGGLSHTEIDNPYVSLWW